MLSEKITEERKKLGLSQEDLAEKLYVSRQSVSKWESGKSLPEITKIIDLATLFGVSTDYLLKDIESKPENESKSKIKDNDVHELSEDEIEKFLTFKKSEARKMALGVFLCIFSPVLNFILVGLYQKGDISYTFSASIGLMSIPLFVAAGVALLASMGVRAREFYYVGDETTYISDEMKPEIQKMKNKCENSKFRKIAIAVFLFILCIMPHIYICFEKPESYYSWVNFSFAFLFATIAVGVFLILYGSVCDSGANELLMTGEQKKRRRAISKKTYALAPYYWIIVTIIYFVVSLITSQWNSTWLIWGVAGIGFPVARKLIAVWYDKKNKR